MCLDSTETLIVLFFLCFFFSILMTINEFEANNLWFLSIVSHFSLFPLLFESNLILVKISLFLSYTLVLTNGLKCLWPFEKQKLIVYYCEICYLFGLIGLLLYEFIIQYLLNLDRRLPFLPLLLTSVYCSIGIMYFWIKYYGIFLFNVNCNQKKRTD